MFLNFVVVPAMDLIVVHLEKKLQMSNIINTDSFACLVWPCQVRV